MDKKQKEAGFTLLAIAITLLLEWFMVTSIIHELGHVIASFACIGWGYIKDWNTSVTHNLPIFDPIVSAMGEGGVAFFYLGIYLITKRNRYAGTALKTFIVYASFYYFRQTDFTECHASIIVLYFIFWLVLRIAFKPFKKKNHKTMNSPSKSVGQKSKSPVKCR
jgi:hypothetical protein